MGATPSTDQDRRRFTRIAFDAHTDLTVGGRKVAVELLDIAFKGVLVKVAEPILGLAVGDCLEAQVTLVENEIALRLPVTLVREDYPYLGFECGALDLETMTHLRRLVELNLGDPALLDRELEHLLDGV